MARSDIIIFPKLTFFTFCCPEFFKLMNEVENEDLVFTLETIVDKFGEEMAPYALGLCQNLVTVSVLFLSSTYSFFSLSFFFLYSAICCCLC